MKPASTSSSTIEVSRKKVEVANARNSRNSTRQMMNRIIDSEWLMMAMRRLVVDFSSSINRITSDRKMIRSPMLTGHRPPDAIGRLNTWAAMRAPASVAPNP
jgi:hypothetical protein